MRSILEDWFSNKIKGINLRNMFGGPNGATVQTSSVDFDEVERITNTKDEKEQLAIAKDPDINKKVLLFQNPFLYPKVHEVLASDEDETIRSIIAKETNLEYVIEGLIDDAKESVRIALVKNPTLNERQKERLARDPSLLVRSALADSDNLPESVMEILKNDASPIVVNKVKNNKSWQNNLPFLDSKKEAIDDSEDFVSQAVSYDNHPFGTPGDLAHTGDKQLEMAKSDKTSAIRLEILSLSNIPEVRREVAKNPKTSIDCLKDMIASDVDPEVVENAQRNLDNRSYDAEFNVKECFGGSASITTTADFAPAVTATMHSTSKKKKK